MKAAYLLVLALCLTVLVICGSFVAGDLRAGGDEESRTAKGREPVVTVAAPDSVGELPEGVQIQAFALGSVDAMSAALVKLIGVKSHFHAAHAELVYVIEGSGTFTVGEGKVHAVPGTVALIPAGVSHAFKADGEEPCLVLSVKVPPADGSDTVFDE